MITIIISDTHLTHKFDIKLFSYLKQIFDSADRIVINGDFWDGYFTTFERLITSKWSALFPLLKRKKTVYLYGNHDRSSWCDERVNLFSAKQDKKYSLQVAEKTLIIMHGNQIAPALDDRIDLIPRYKKIMSYLIYIARLYLQTKMGKNHLKHYDLEIKKWWIKNRKEKQYLVCGHSHWPEFDLKKRYINTGFIRYHQSHYLKVDDDKLQLISEKY